MVTLKTLAAKAGCSENTVSLVLRDRGRISDRTRSKIKKLASNLGYRPNFAARSLVTGRTGLIGIFIPSEHYDYVRIEMVKHLLEELHNSQFKPILGLEESTTDIWYNSSWFKTFHEINVDAIILSTNLRELPAFLRQTPIISLGVQPNTVASPEWDTVALDRSEAGQMAARHVIEKGHQKIFVMSSDPGYFYDGVLSVLNSSAGVSFETCNIFTPETPQPDPKVLYNCMRQSNLNPTAVVCSDALIAVQFAKECANAGMSLPADLSIVAYDYLPNIESYPVPLTLVEQPIREVVNAAKQLLMRRIEQPTAEYQQVAVSHRLIERKSTIVNPEII